MASLRLLAVIGMVSACASTPGPTVTKPVPASPIETTPRVRIERELAEALVAMYGITEPLRCPSAVLPTTCELTHGGETHQVIVSSADEAGKKSFTIRGPHHVLVPLGLVTSIVTIPIQCADKNYMRFELAKPIFCKVIESGDYLRLVLTNLETKHLKIDRVRAPESELREWLAGFDLEMTMTCRELALVDAAPGTCEVKTTTGEQFQIRFRLGHPGFVLARDGAPVIILPKVTTVHATGQDVPLECPRRIVRAGETVRCSYVSRGKRFWSEISLDSNGSPRVETR